MENWISNHDFNQHKKSRKENLPGFFIKVIYIILPDNFSILSSS